MESNKNISPDQMTDDNPPPPERQGTPDRPPYSPVTPVLRNLALVPGGEAVIPPNLETLAAGTTLSATSGSPNFTGTTAAASNRISTEPFRQPNVPTYDESPVNRRTIPPPPPPQTISTNNNITTTPNIRPEPSPVPISESDNPDVIALRSTISILQLQKQKALNDIKTLDEIKRAAAADPEGFSNELLAGRLTQEDRLNNSFIDTSLPLEGVNRQGRDGEEGDDDDSAMDTDPVSKFGKIPKPQNVVRMPPINWSKYQIVGEPLDRMHEEQRNRPFTGVPRQNTSQRAPEHVIAAPYRPLTDKIESPAKGKSKRDRKA